MSIPYATVDRKRGFLSSLGMERSMLYLLAGLLVAVFLMLTILGSEPSVSSGSKPEGESENVATDGEMIAIGGDASK